MNCRILYKKELNSIQLEVVNFTQGPLLVIAGACWKREDENAYISDRTFCRRRYFTGFYTSLTFTRKAAREMLNRATELLDDVAGGTFHSFAYAVLRKYACKVGFEHGFSIIDRSDSEDLISMMRRKMAGASKSGFLPRKQTLTNIFSRAVNKNMAVDDIVLNDYPQLIRHLEAIHEISLVYQRRIKDKKPNMILWITTIF